MMIDTKYAVVFLGIFSLIKNRLFCMLKKKIKVNILVRKQSIFLPLKKRGVNEVLFMLEQANFRILC